MNQQEQQEEVVEKERHIQTTTTTTTTTSTRRRAKIIPKGTLVKQWQPFLVIGINDNGRIKKKNNMKNMNKNNNTSISSSNNDKKNHENHDNDNDDTDRDDIFQELPGYISCPIFSHGCKVTKKVIDAVTERRICGTNHDGTATASSSSSFTPNNKKLYRFIQRKLLSSYWKGIDNDDKELIYETLCMMTLLYIVLIVKPGRKKIEMASEAKEARRNEQASDDNVHANVHVNGEDDNQVLIELWPLLREYYNDTNENDDINITWTTCQWLYDQIRQSLHMIHVEHPLRSDYTKNVILQQFVHDIKDGTENYQRAIEIALSNKWINRRPINHLEFSHMLSNYVTTDTSVSFLSDRPIGILLHPPWDCISTTEQRKDTEDDDDDDTSIRQSPLPNCTIELSMSNASTKTMNTNTNTIIMKKKMDNENRENYDDIRSNFNIQCSLYTSYDISRNDESFSILSRPRRQCFSSNTNTMKKKRQERKSEQRRRQRQRRSIVSCFDENPYQVLYELDEIILHSSPSSSSSDNENEETNNNLYHYYSEQKGKQNTIIDNDHFFKTTVQRLGHVYFQQGSSCSSSSGGDGDGDGEGDVTNNDDKEGREKLNLAMKLYQKCYAYFSKQQQHQQQQKRLRRQQEEQYQQAQYHRHSDNDDDFEYQYQYQILDLCHTMAAIELTQLQFVNSQKRWRDCYNVIINNNDNNTERRSVHEHSGIQLQIEKQKAYRYFDNNDTTNQNHDHDQHGHDNSRPTTAAIPKYETIGTIEPIYITSDMISKQQCQQLIDWAEEYTTSSTSGSNNKWTTNRHYAVPTTDIPIHQVPKLLHWFNSWMDQHMIPLLRHQFLNENESNTMTTTTKGIKKNKKRFYIHDAFLVRYNACNDENNKNVTKNHYLPLHYDESTHSFVIALNDDFIGGGTYFYEHYNTIITPKTGCVVTFRGNRILHGGNILRKGIRYIIAVFLYLDDDMKYRNDDGDNNLGTRQQQQGQGQGQEEEGSSEKRSLSQMFSSSQSDNTKKKRSKTTTMRTTTETTTKSATRKNDEDGYGSKETFSFSFF